MTGRGRGLGVTQGLKGRETVTVYYSNFTGRGRGGVLLGDDILKEFGKGCF